MLIIKNLPVPLFLFVLTFAVGNSQAATLATINGSQIQNGYGDSTQTVIGTTLRIEAPLSRYGRTYTFPSTLTIQNQATTFAEVDIQFNTAHGASTPVFLALEDTDLAPTAGQETHFYSLSLSGVGTPGFTTITVPFTQNPGFTQNTKDGIVNYDSGGLFGFRIAGSYNDTVTDITISQVRIIDSVPEPSAALLGGLGLGLAVFLRKRR